MIKTAIKHPHYFRSVEGLSHVDVYRVLVLFSVTDPCLQHAIKKLLVAGGRGGGKDISRDVQEAIDTLERWQDMRGEDDASRAPTGAPLPPLPCGCGLGSCMGPQPGQFCERGYPVQALPGGVMLCGGSGPVSSGHA